MAAPRLNDLNIVVAAGIAIVLLGTAAAVFAPTTGDADLRTSSYSSGPRGAKAAYLTLHALAYRVERSIEPMTAVRVDPSTTTFILTGREAPSEQDRRAFKAFVEAGGTLLAVGDNGAFALGLPVTAAEPKLPTLDADAIETFHPLTPTPVSRGASAITMESRVARPTLTDAYVPVFGSSSEAPVVAVAAMGQGRAIWFADITPLANGQLAEADNLRLLLNVAGAPGRLVLFDEHYQGHKRTLWSYTGGTPVPWVAAQLGLLLVAVLLTHSRRRGPVRPPFTEARRSPMEFVDMLAALYKRAHAKPAAVHAARTRLRRVIAASCGVPLATDDETLARAAGARLHTDPAPIAQALADADRVAADPRVGGAQALEVMQRLQALAGNLSGSAGL